MSFRVPGLDVQQHQIDLLQLVVAQTLAQETIRVERGVNAQLASRGEKSYGKTVLHQRLATAERETAKHCLETMTILFQLVDRSLQRYRHPIAQIPRIGVMTIQTSKLAARGTGHQPRSWSIDRGSGCE